MVTQTTSRSLGAALLGAGALALGIAATPAVAQDGATVALTGGAPATCSIA